MADIGKALKDEITRISLREVRKVTGDTKKSIAALKRELIALRKQVNQSIKNGKPVSKAPATETSESKKTAGAPGSSKVWFTAKGIKSLRNRLGLSQEEFGQLCEVSKKSVSNWELADKGKLNLRSATLEILAKIRKMSASSARKALAEKTAGK